MCNVPDPNLPDLNLHAVCLASWPVAAAAKQLKAEQPECGGLPEPRPLNGLNANPVDFS
jgi:hypothetical protein